MHLKQITIYILLVVPQFVALATYAQAVVSTCCCGFAHAGPCGLSNGLSDPLPGGHYFGDGHNHYLPIGMEAVDTGSSPDIAALSVRGRWTTTATDGFVGNIQGEPVTLTWGIVQEGSDINNFASQNGTSDLISFLDTVVGNPADASLSDLEQKSWFPIVESSYERWEALSGLTFNFEPNDDGIPLSTGSGMLGTRADLRLAGVDILSGQALAFNAFPNDGDGILDTDNPIVSNSGNNFIRLRNLIGHEVGHGLGFGHVESAGASFLMEPNLGSSFEGPQLDDILAVHRNYGDFFEKNGGNDTFATAISLGSVNRGTRLGLGLDAMNTETEFDDTDFYSIDGNSDKDFFEFTLDSPQTVSLGVAPQGPTYSIAPENVTQTNFASRRNADLHLTLYDANQNVIGTSTEAGRGGTELFTNFNLEAGTYFAEVSSPDDAVQMYRLDLKTESDDRVFLVDEDFAVDGTPPPAPRASTRVPADEIEFTFTAGPDGLIGTAPQGFFSEGDAIASSRNFDATFESVTNSIEFTVDAIGLYEIELELVAFQHTGSFEDNDSLIIEVDTGNGYFTLLQDTEVWNGENDLIGEGSFGRDGNNSPTSTARFSFLKQLIRYSMFGSQ